MARRLTGSLTWERFALILSLGIAGVALGQANGAVISAVVGFVFVTTLGVETVRHREQLRELR